VKAGSVGITGADADDCFESIRKNSNNVRFQSDAFYVGNELQSSPSGNSLVFLRYSNYQPNNPGILDVAGWPTATAYGWIMSLRANGKLYLGTNPEAACGDCSEFRMFVKDGIRTEKVKLILPQPTVGQIMYLKKLH
jgi:hypothetical protein